MKIGDFNKVADVSEAKLPPPETVPPAFRLDCQQEQANGLLQKLVVTFL